MKYLVITGASGNLGRELIKFFDFQNFDFVILVGREELLKGVIPDSNKFKVINRLDLTKEENVEKIFEVIEEKKEDELFVIHLVGKYEGGKSVWDYSSGDVMGMFITNFLTAFLVSKYAIKKVRNMKGGSIVFVSSKLTLDYYPERSVYAISKNALNFYVKIIEKEAKELNFTANVLAPSTILTEINKKWIDYQKQSDYSSPKDLADLIYSIFQNYRRLNGNIFIVNDKF